MIFKRIKKLFRCVVGKGKTRLVFAFPELGFVIKFPIIELKEVLLGNIKDIREGHWKIVKLLWSVKASNPYIGYRGGLFRGIQANWFEWVLYQTTHNKLLYPTWFSFLGLCNIAKYGEPLPYKGICVHIIIARVTNNESFKCGHGFETPVNYTKNRRGKIRMIDYGNKRLWPVILKYGAQIAELTIDDVCDTE